MIAKASRTVGILASKSNSDLMSGGDAVNGQSHRRHDSDHQPHGAISPGNDRLRIVFQTSTVGELRNSKKTRREIDNARTEGDRHRIHLPPPDKIGCDNRYQNNKKNLRHHLNCIRRLNKCHEENNRRGHLSNGLPDDSGHCRSHPTAVRFGLIPRLQEKVPFNAFAACLCAGTSSRVPVLTYAGAGLITSV